MSIKKVTKRGETYFNIFVGMRSKKVPNLRVQRMRTKVPTMKAARAAEREMLHEVAVDLAKREVSGEPWEVILDEWYLAHKRPKAGTRILQADTILEKHVTLRRFTEHWFNKVCDEITPGDVRSVMRSMEEAGYSKGRMKTVRSGINVVYRWAIEEGRIKNVHHSPAIGITLGKDIQEKPPQILSMGEIQKLLDEAKAMNSEWYPIWTVALNSGMRSGELYALEWNDIDLDHRLITVSKSYNGRLKLVKSTKAGYWRKVPINDELLKLLYELKAMNSQKPIEHQPYVLPRNERWRRGEAAKMLREFCDAIGISSVCFHALRACFATHLLNAGVSSPIVKKICGWTDEKVMNRYIRLAGIDVAGATDKLGFRVPERDERKVVNLVEFRGQKRD